MLFTFYTLALECTHTHKVADVSEWIYFDTVYNSIWIVKSSNKTKRKENTQFDNDEDGYIWKHEKELNSICETPDGIKI